MTVETLFPLPSDVVKVTSDDCYTPRWVFDAMGLEFDIDAAAPPGGPWHVPCKRFYTAEDDGLAQPWDGLTWCNPPYSNFWPWAQKYVQAERAVIMGFALPQTKWFPHVIDNSDAAAFIRCAFARPDGTKFELRQQIFVAFRGVGTEPATRLADADPYGAVLYGPKGRLAE